MRYSNWALLLIFGCFGCDKEEIGTLQPPPPPPPPAQGCPTATASAGGGRYVNLHYDREAWLFGGYSSVGGPMAFDTVTWKQVSGPGSARLATPDRMNTLVTVPTPGHYEFSLTLKNGCGTSNTDTTFLHVTNGPFTTSMAAPANPRRRDLFLTWPQNSASLFTREDVGANCSGTPYVQVAGPTTVNLTVASYEGWVQDLKPGTYLFKAQQCSPGMDTLAIHVLEDPVEKNTLTYPSLVKRQSNALSIALSAADFELYSWMEPAQFFFRAPSGTWQRSGTRVNDTQYDIKLMDGHLVLVSSDKPFDPPSGWQMKVRL